MTPRTHPLSFPPWTLLLLWTLLLWTLPTPALAQQESEGVPAADADTLIERGLALREQGRDSDALVLFERAFASGGAHAEAQLALAHQALGHWLDAEAHLRSALETTEPWIEARRAVLERELERIRGRLGRVEVLGGVEGAEVRFNDRVAGTLPLDGPVLVVAGSVVVSVHAEDHHAFSRRIEVGEGRLVRETVHLVAIEREPAQTAATTGPRAPRGAHGSPTESGAPPPGDPPWLGVGLGAFGVAAVAAGVGIAFSVSWQSNVETWNGDGCLERMPGETRESNCPNELRALEDAEIGMIVAYAGAGLFAITGAVLVALGASSSAGPETALRCSPAGLGLVCGGRF